MASSAEGRRRAKQIRGQVPADPITSRLRRLEAENGLRLSWRDLADELQQVLAAVHGNQTAMDDFARVIAGMTSPAEFFSEENVGLILAAAA